MSEIINENKEYVIVDKESFVTIADAARAAMGTEEEYSITELAEAIAGSVLPPPAVEDAGKVATVNEEGKWEMQEAQSGLPADPGAYKYMATDGEGKWVADDRLAWSEVEKGAVILPETTLSYVGEAHQDMYPPIIESAKDYGFPDTNPLTLLEVGKTYTVTYNGKPYTCEAHSYWRPWGPANTTEVVCLGNRLFVYGVDTGEPFLIEYNEPYESFRHLVALDNAENVTVSICESQETIEKINKKYLPDVFTFDIVKKEEDGYEYFAATKPFYEITNALRTGKTVFCCGNIKNIFGNEDADEFQHFVLPFCGTSCGDIAGRQNFPNAGVLVFGGIVVSDEYAYAGEFATILINWDNIMVGKPTFNVPNAQ